MNVTNLHRLYNRQFNKLIDIVGKTIKVPNGTSDCPNCHYDRVRQISNGIYDTGNTYPLDSKYNRVFLEGETCPVCGGVGKISSWTSITAIVNWTNSGLNDAVGIELNTNLCTIKVAYSYYDVIRVAKTVQVPIVKDSYIECEIISFPTGFGIGDHKFFTFTAEAKL